ncbi:MAG: sulfur carrier protein ThiS [Nitrospiraceae bacterium]|nr:sulfur carrier protein ThiS [Nitrospiraceae bacterium]
MARQPYPGGIRLFYFMRLRINGEIMEIRDAATVGALLEHLGVEPARVAVEVNLAVVKKADYGSFRLNDGDEVEIVNFVGGG